MLPSAAPPERVSAEPPDNAGGGGHMRRPLRLSVRPQKQAPAEPLQPADIFLHSYDHEAGGRDVVFMNPLASSGLLFVQPGGERVTNGGLRRLDCGSVGSSVSVPTLGESSGGCSRISVAGSCILDGTTGDSGVGKVGSSEEAVAQKRPVGDVVAVIRAAVRACFCGLPAQ